MSTDDKKINVDDITFDDMLDGGIEDALETLDEPQVEEPIENEEPKEQVEETSLDADVETKKEEDQRQGQVLAESEIPQGPEAGVIEKPAEASAEETSGPIDDSVVAQVLESLGYETDQKYEDTAEGLTQMAKDVGSNLAEEQLDTLF